METELTLSIGGFPPLSSRGCTQELRPVSTGQFHRTINGELIYTGPQTTKKYYSLIYCEDKAPIATDGLHRGATIKVNCIQRLWQKISADETVITLEKNPVEGSVIAYDEQHNSIGCKIDSNKVILTDCLDVSYISYRPILDMSVLSYKLTTNEWGVKVGWSLELEEI